MKTQLSHVSSEGGPLLLGDYDDLRHWNGSDFKLYQMACEVEEFAIRQIAFDGKSGLAWDFGGAGTAYLVRSEAAETIFVRYWSDRELSDSEVVELVKLDAESVATAALAVTSGNVLVLWAAEDARKLMLPESGFGTPKGLAIGDGGCFIALAVGRYEVVASHYHKDKIEVVALQMRQQ